MISWWWWNTKLIDPSTLALDKLVKHAPRATCEHRMHNRIKPAGFHQLKLTSHIYDHLWYAIPLWSIGILLFRNRSSAPRLHIWKHQWSPSTCRKTSPASLCKQWLLAVLGDELNWSHWLDFSPRKSSKMAVECHNGQIWAQGSMAQRGNPVSEQSTTLFHVFP